MKPKNSLEALCQHTGTKPEDWEELEGPNSGVGLDYWFVHKNGMEAYVNEDQGEYTVDVGEEEA